MSQSIPKPFIDEVIARTDIVELIDARVPLKKRGNNCIALCPFHQEKSPSFTVNANKQFYYCFGCAASGNAISFLMAHDHMGFVEAVEALANHLGLDIPYAREAPKHNYNAAYDLMQSIANDYHQALFKSEKTINYLRQRGFDEKSVKKYLMGYAQDSWHHLSETFPSNEKILVESGMIIQKESKTYDRFRDRLMFPIRDLRGRVIGFGGRVLNPEDQPKYLNSPETPYFQKGQHLYGLYELRQHQREFDYILLVEGYVDVVSLSQYEINNAVATLGTAISPQHIKQLCRLTDRIVFCFDGDDAGKQAAWRALEILLPVMHDGIQAQFLLLPDGHDPDSFVRRYGKDIFEAKVKDALPLSTFFFQHFLETANLTTIDGKASFSEKIKPYFAKMPAGVFKNLMLERLAELLKTPINNLDTDVTRDVKPKSTPRHRTKQLSPLRTAIGLLIQNPNLIASLENQSLKHLTQTQGPGLDLLRDLIDYLTTNPNASTGMLLEHWRESPDMDAIQKLASLVFPFPEDGLSAEFIGALVQVEAQALSQKIQHLMEKNKEKDGLSRDEKRELQALLMESKGKK